MRPDSGITIRQPELTRSFSLGAIVARRGSDQEENLEKGNEKMVKEQLEFVFLTGLVTCES